MAAADRASARGDQFRIVRGSPVVDRLFSLTGFEHRLEMTLTGDGMNAGASALRAR